MTRNGTTTARTIRRAGAVAGAAAVLLAALPTATASAAQAAGRSGRPAWCPAVEGHRVDCGTVGRPVVAGKPWLGTVPVAYAVVRHREAGPARGTVAINPGGPGETAVDRAEVFAAALRGVLAGHDVLLVDPRGTGRSGRIPCGVSDAEYRFADRAGQRDAIARCAANLGPRAEGYTSAATADDIDAVRARIGAESLLLYGLSYGTYLMPVYAARHPGRVDAMVLSGAYPLNVDPLARPSADAVSLALKRVCERSGVCDGDTAVADLRTVAGHLRERPVTLRIDAAGATRTLRFTEDKLANLLYEAASRGAGESPAERSLLGDLPAALHDAAGGDDRALRALVRADYGGATREDQASFLAVVCNDYPRAWSVDSPLPARWREYRAALSAADPARFGAFSVEGFTEGQTDGADACIQWPRRGTARPQPVDGAQPDVPVLLFAGDLDSNTAESATRRAATQFRRATVVAVPNVGHVAELESTHCALAIVEGFVRTGRPGDTSCVNAVPPIAVAPVRR
ncbi:alpha/beta fold hydrolase [Kitasatospora sp. NPDC093550]|uniref:alpha/beta fold hydrolase n=1 Tax=Kitasatospora sp. NPDC093550 TaxID=3364089 RepID=UPI00382D35CB